MVVWVYVLALLLHQLIALPEPGLHGQHVVLMDTKSDGVQLMVQIHKFKLVRLLPPVVEAVGVVQPLLLLLVFQAPGLREAATEEAVQQVKDN
jgi:hypothetical protein